LLGTKDKQIARLLESNNKTTEAFEKLQTDFHAAKAAWTRTLRDVKVEAEERVRDADDRAKMFEREVKRLMEGGGGGGVSFFPKETQKKLGPQMKGAFPEAQALPKKRTKNPADNKRDAKHRKLPSPKDEEEDEEDEEYDGAGDGSGSESDRTASQ